MARCAASWVAHWLEFGNGSADRERRTERTLRQTMNIIHTNFDRWLIAAVHGDLSTEERQLLNEHLVNCAECRRRSEDEAAVEHVHAILAGRRVFDPDFESRIVREFRGRTAPKLGVRELLCRAAGLRAVRIGVALTVGLLLLVRGLELEAVKDTFVSRAGLSALWETVLHSPQDTDLIGKGHVLANHDELLATVHKLTTLYVETFMWVVLLAAVGLVVLDLYRRRVRQDLCR